MLDKLIKGLWGLGGVAALTTGGMFLKNHVDRKNFLWESDTKAKILEGDDGLVKLFKSNMEQEIIERNWIGEVALDSSYQIKNFTREEMEEREAARWNFINTKVEAKPGEITRYIDIKSEDRERIKNQYSEYWEKYYESCLLWNISRDGDDTFPSGSNPLCTLLVSSEEYQKRDEYKEYKKLKEKGLNMSVSEYYWTVWKKFKNDKNGQINDEDGTNSNTSTLFAEWMKDGKNSSLFTNAGIKDLGA